MVSCCLNITWGQYCFCLVVFSMKQKHLCVNSSDAILEILNGARTVSYLPVQGKITYESTGSNLRRWRFRDANLPWWDGYKTKEDLVSNHSPFTDVLWVKEKYAFTDLASGAPVIAYQAGNTQIVIGKNPVTHQDYLIHDYTLREEVYVDSWKLAKKMPEWASRIRLKVIGVDIEQFRRVPEKERDFHTGQTVMPTSASKDEFVWKITHELVQPRGLTQN